MARACSTRWNTAVVVLAGSLLLAAPASAEAARFCVDPDWPPFETITAGRHEGIAADLLRLAAERAGVALELVVTANWDETLDLARQGRCDLLSFLNQSPKRDEWLIFTQPLFVDRNVIITREEHRYVDDLSAVTGETIVLPSGTSIEERVRRDFPDLTVVTTASEAEAFAMVSERKADMTIRSLTVAVYTIKKEGWFNLKISGQVPGYENHLRVGVRKDLPTLRDALDQGIATITNAERSEIANRHVAIQVASGVDYQLLAEVAGAFSLVLLTSLVWGLKLRAVNRLLVVQSRTDALTRLANRAYLDERLSQEFDRVARHGGALSIILADLDHFKRVNDELGHQAGDKVLVALATILRSTVRSTDVAGRWGGEEFLVVCPDTSLDQAAVLAHRLCAAVREHRFHSGWPQTVSLGVATLGVGAEDLDGLLRRTDQALYQAKDAGRDQVRIAASLPPPSS